MVSFVSPTQSEGSLGLVGHRSLRKSEPIRRRIPRSRKLRWLRRIGSGRLAATEVAATIAAFGTPRLRTLAFFLRGVGRFQNPEVKEPTKQAAAGGADQVDPPPTDPIGGEGHGSPTS